MTLKARGVLILGVGIALGLGLSMGAGLWQKREADARAAEQSAAPHVQILSDVMQRVRREYVDPIDDDALIASAIRGMLADLDTHSRYLGPDEYEGIRVSTSGNYYGVGLDVSTADGKLVVVHPVDGAPAAQAGILPGDIVIAVDEMPIDSRNLQDAVSRMRGRPGTRVTLDVVREGTQEPMRFALTRVPIQVQTVRSELLGGAYAYLRLTGFSDSTARELDAAVAALERQAGGGRLKGVVLDLRGNPGGVLDAAVQVADRFLDHGLIVRGSGRYQQAKFEHHAKAGDRLEGLPVAVLVNGGTASASEIVAGALQDHSRAQLIGERTYGKGSVQTVMPVAEGSAIKLTTSRYVTPSGRMIHGAGIDPDVVVRNRSQRRQYRGPGSTAPVSEDDQLQEALRYLGYDAIALTQL